MRMDVMRSAGVILAGMLLVAGCSREQGAAVEMSAAPVAADAAAELAAAAPPQVDAGDMQTATGTSADPARRFVITGDARFKVADVYKSTLAIEDAVAAEGGFVLRNAMSVQPGSVRQQSLGEGKVLRLTEFTRTGELVVRLPVARTQSFLRGIVAQMEFMDARDVTAVDVQFDELRQRLAAQRAADSQARIGQAARQPGKVGEKVDAEDARYGRAGDRDEAELRQRELEDRVAFSTLTLWLYQSPQLRKETLVDTDAAMRTEGPGFWQRMTVSLQGGWQGLLSVLVALATLWPLWLAIVLGTMIWSRRHRFGWPRRTPQASTE